MKFPFITLLMITVQNYTGYIPRVGNGKDKGNIILLCFRGPEGNLFTVILIFSNVFIIFANQSI